MPADLLGADFMHKTRNRLARLRPWVHEVIYANEIGNLRIDTFANSPEQMRDIIDERLAGDPGIAFGTLRQLYPR